MAFTNISKSDKLIALNAAKAEFERDLYRNLTRLGVDADVYDVDGFSFDPNASSEDTDPEYKIKELIARTIQKLAVTNEKISNL
jgi:hypothetical protein